MGQALQDRFAAKSICFGCGPANTLGLGLKSIVDDHNPEIVRCTYSPGAEHQAFPQVLNGGIIGTLLDCHSNWTAAWTLMQRDKAPEPPCTVTADFHIKLLRPTPLDTLTLEARAVEASQNRVRIEAKLIARGKVCATCDGNFVAVEAGHPAFHRW